MDEIILKDIKKYCEGKYINKVNECFLIKNIKIDSREADKDSLYIPILGTTYDGHEFLNDAYNNGCRNFLINKEYNFFKKNANIIGVDNTNIALGNIAKCYKEKFDIFYIGVTGSVGKTSTKDMIYSVLSQKYKTLKNVGNLNNNIGLPRTIFNLNNSYKAAVLEMGMSYQNEIKYLADIVKPNIAIISNIGLSHIENFKNQEDIFNTKMEITSNFNKDNILIINGDDNYLKTLKEKKLEYTLFSYGFNKDNTIYCNEYEIMEDAINFSCVYKNEEYKFTIPTIAKHNILNAMSAILVGLELNMSINEIKEGLNTFEITKGRLTIIKKKDITIIDDSYNASLDSTISALNVLKTYNTRRVAILGDILETGSYEKKIHVNIGKNIVNNVDLLITVGNSTKYVYETALLDGFDKNNILHFNDYTELIKEIKKIIKSNDVVLLKASHGINLFEVVEYLEKEYE